MRAAVAALKQHQPAAIVVAVPVGARSTCEEFAGIADRCICAITPEHFRSVGLWYDDFGQTGDTEVCELSPRRRPPGGARSGRSRAAKSEIARRS